MVTAMAILPVKMNTSTAVVIVAQVRQETALRTERLFVSYCISDLR